MVIDIIRIIGNIQIYIKLFLKFLKYYFYLILLFFYNKDFYINKK